MSVTFDHDRACRIGLPESIFCASKSIEAIAALAFDHTRPGSRPVLFTRMAQAEGAVHGINPGHAHFHEVGALDSILDVCVCCALFDRLAPARFVCSPLPVCDGTVRCAHGLLPPRPRQPLRCSPASPSTASLPKAKP